MRAYKIKPVLFLYAVGFLTATKTLHKRKEKVIFSPNITTTFVGNKLGIFFKLYVIILIEIGIV